MADSGGGGSGYGAILAGLVGIGTSIFSHNSIAKNLGAQMGTFARIKQENDSTAKNAAAQETDLVNSLPELNQLLQKGADISAFQRKDLLDFTMGASQGDLRQAQKTNAEIANFDFSSLNENISKVLRSGQFDIVAAAAGQPIGTIANLSAQNVFSFAQQGLQNTMAIGDYFAKVGQIDRVNPYNVATDLYNISAAKVGQKINIQDTLANRLITNNNNFASMYADVKNAENANTANMYAGINAAAATMASGSAGQSSNNTNSETSGSSMAGYASLAAMFA